MAKSTAKLKPADAENQPHQPIPLSHLHAWDLNPRKSYEHADIVQIADTIHNDRLLHPLRAFPIAGMDGHFRVYIGGKRHKAYLYLAEKSLFAADGAVDTYVDEIDEITALQRAIVENDARSDIDLIDRAEAILHLANMHKTRREISRFTGISISRVDQALEVAKLNEPAKQLIKTKKRSYEWAAQLAQCETHMQERILDEVEHNPAAWASPSDIKAERRKKQVDGRFAIFDLAKSGIAYEDDMFSEEKWIADVEAFWNMQRAEIENVKTALTNDGHVDVMVVNGNATNLMNYVEQPNSSNRRAIIEVQMNGKVTVHPNLVPIDLSQKIVDNTSPCDDEEAATRQLAGIIGETITTKAPKGAAAKYMADLMTRHGMNLISDQTTCLKALIMAITDGQEIKVTTHPNLLTPDQVMDRRDIVSMLRDDTATIRMENLPNNEHDLIGIICDYVRNSLSAVASDAKTHVSEDGTNMALQTHNPTLLRRIISKSPDSLRKTWTPDADFLELLDFKKELIPLAMELYINEDTAWLENSNLKPVMLIAKLAADFADAKKGIYSFDVNTAILLNDWLPDYMK